ncbi:hypothetical protein AGDE_16639 [Angomonas deanei]|uniref:Mitochondrial import inner membrane translocase subunit TIM50 n=1 Tax=Angomonas deanei TaxID=59799 RepID=A0A7G2CDI3_9TRYP|nr:hypothetical protein AGDE_16639 [Angomonas deanei]CAD2216904.1 NLI interacting factor-like phosphatase, putative [Angomonas deanei]|eukprot:EPY16721.1 hypothetical protein AGDE_16639 [Angomonas deanei]
MEVSALPHQTHFELNQFVRVTKKNAKRTEIGIISDIHYKNNNTNEEVESLVVTTRQGYDVVVRPDELCKAFLLVLDLNGVLVARGRGEFILRPHVDEFIKFVFQYFPVAVWTSGLERTSIPVIEKVFKDYRDRLLFTYYRGACESRPTPLNPYGTVKNLQIIFDQYPESFHAVNTIIIDDSPDKCSHPDIALCPLPFHLTEENTHHKDEDGLLKIIKVLEEVLKQDSLLPLINAAEERLRLLQEKGLPTEKSTFSDFFRGAQKKYTKK